MSYMFSMFSGSRWACDNLCDLVEGHQDRTAGSFREGPQHVRTINTTNYIPGSKLESKYMFFGFFMHIRGS